MPADLVPQNNEDRERFIDAVFEGVVALIDARLKDIVNRVRDIEDRPPPARGEPGKDAEPISAEMLRKIVDEALDQTDFKAAMRAFADDAVEEYTATELPKLIPAPIPGKDATPVDLEALRKDVVAACNEVLHRDVDEMILVHVNSKLVEMAEQLKGQPGRPGDPGKDAPPVDMEAVAAAISAKVMPLLEKSIEDERVAMFGQLQAALAAEVKALPRPKDADPIDYVRVLDWIGERVRKEFEDRKESLRGPKGDPGESIKGDPGPKGDSIRGDPGRDAADPELINRVVKDAFQRWSKSLEMGVEQVNERDVIVSISLGDQLVVEKTLHFDVVIFRGPWQDGQPSNRGDVKAWDGSSWHCNVDGCTTKPSNEGNPDWTLMTKRGRDGRDLLKKEDAPKPELLRLK